MEFLITVSNRFENFPFVIAGEKTGGVDLIVLRNMPRAFSSPLIAMDKEAKRHR
jgi:hypothetical protein